MWGAGQERSRYIWKIVRWSDKANQRTKCLCVEPPGYSSYRQRKVLEFGSGFLPSVFYSLSQSKDVPCRGGQQRQHLVYLLLVLSMQSQVIQGPGVPESAAVTHTHILQSDQGHTVAIPHRAFGRMESSSGPEEEQPSGWSSCQSASQTPMYLPSRTSQCLTLSNLLCTFITKRKTPKHLQEELTTFRFHPCFSTASPVWQQPFIMNCVFFFLTHGFTHGYNHML